MLKPLIEKVLKGQDLTQEEMAAVGSVMDGRDPIQAAAFWSLSGRRVRKRQITGAAQAMRQR